ncbi:PhzF family phenazine biosynthesis protein [Dyadobacter frigoris]|uniref:PhzF family phenazine biosynthesis protein n=1 Tax=Dyadobacter frigoris TaxID=2576211 RepID=A0A4U6D2K5_9BACT|nr:PhzF family phenazine biosynthesis protein [Dyadobacter frigoris]TKT88094.1 PhzF family phenazine biosynthesis protein [Dyadobacter frigoris]GLU53705.1 isomerase [Dyadobacter frigoris]
MKFELYQIDAFTEKIFGGNPACVVPLENWLPDDLLLKITKENAVAETAFFVITGDRIHLRWFTPEIEMDLCGHATLATAHALKTISNYPKDEIIFDTLSGELVVTTSEDMYFLNFPSRKAIPADLPENIKKSLNIEPKSVLKARDYVLVYDTESEIRNIKIDRHLFDQINLDPGGVIVTAKGNDCDFVSRFFTPQASILEDPVTGSAHCTLIPYWSEKFGKKEMKAEQISERSGKLLCFDQGDRVLIGGKAKTYAAGHFWIE